MNKFEKYYNKSDRYNWLWNKAIKHNDKFLISDTYSIICLNKNTTDKYFIDIVENENFKQIVSMYEDFENLTYWKDLKTDIDFKKITLKECEEKENNNDILIDTNDIENNSNKYFGIGLQETKRIYNAIKFDKIEIYYGSYWNSLNVVYKLINSSTCEFAFLLPTRRF